MKHHFTPLLVHASLNLFANAQAPTFIAGDMAQYTAKPVSMGPHLE
jgi:hypothetical protein